LRAAQVGSSASFGRCCAAWTAVGGAPAEYASGRAWITSLRGVANAEGKGNYGSSSVQKNTGAKCPRICIVRSIDNQCAGECGESISFANVIRNGRARGGGGPLLYQNWLRRYWKPAFAKLDLPYVEPHSARHCFISTLQAQGVEVGLVAKLAGHANPAVTLSHYTQAVRGGEQAIAALEDAYAGAM
jgi:hypothetical protein